MDINEAKKETADSIIEAVKFSVILGILAQDLGIELSASLYLNVRDAMFHYRMLCNYAEKQDNENMLKHYYNLKEHIIRGEKDAIILLSGNVLDALSEISRQNVFDEFTSSEVKKLQSNSHNIKDIVLRIRTDGIRPDSAKGFPLDIFSELTVYIKNIVKICEGKNIPLF